MCSGMNNWAALVMASQTKNVHGVVAQKEWRRLELPLPTGVQIHFMGHFSRIVSYEDIDEVSRKIQNASR